MTGRSQEPSRHASLCKSYLPWSWGYGSTASPCPAPSEGTPRCEWEGSGRQHNSDQLLCAPGPSLSRTCPISLSPPHSAGVPEVDHCTQIFAWILRIQSQVLMLAQQALHPLRHLSALPDTSISKQVPLRYGNRNGKR